MQHISGTRSNRRRARINCSNGSFALPMGFGFLDVPLTRLRGKKDEVNPLDWAPKSVPTWKKFEVRGDSESK